MNQYEFKIKNFKNNEADEKKLWLSQMASMPDLRCAKGVMLDRISQLLREVESNELPEQDSESSKSEKEAKRQLRQATEPLRQMGLIEFQAGLPVITEDGIRYLQSGDVAVIANLLAERVRLFAEVLGKLTKEELTVQEMNEWLISNYNLDWKSDGNTRVRMTWLEVLGLTEWLGGRKQHATETGRQLFADWSTVSPESLDFEPADVLSELDEVPTEIASLLTELRLNPKLHDKRSTYNIWVPSPSSSPSKIDNMFTMVSKTLKPINREDYLNFIASHFELRRSSVNSILPFMRAGGFIEEVQRGIYLATSQARSWVESGSRQIFVRLLHANMRFVGELLNFTSVKRSRSEVYTEAVQYGLNKEKCRWIMSFLIDADLLFETSFSTVQTTSLGLLFVDDLPLADPPEVSGDSAKLSELQNSFQESMPFDRDSEEARRVAESLRIAARDPGAEGKAAGKAFEEAIRDAFELMGFSARHISGSGDTDVLVKWSNENGEIVTAVVDGKSTASGRISHTNVSDVALSSHMEKNSAEFVAIVAPDFAGDTIALMAQKRGWALITAEELARLVEVSQELGLTPAEIGLVFVPAEGMTVLADRISSRERELEIISLVISRLRKESEDDEPLSPRDISLIERSSSVSPSVLEVRQTFETFDRIEVGVVRSVEASTDARFATYELGDARSSIRKLRALASAIEDGLASET